MKYGFIGLGHLGKTMAKRLIAGGVDLTVWNRTREKAADLGVPVADTPADLISSVDAVFLSLFDSDAVAPVLMGRDGILNGDCHGNLIIDLTSNHPDRVLRFHAIVREHRARYLECPVLGSVVPASNGTLVILASGDEKDLESVRPALTILGDRIVYLGPPGQATRMKLVNNLVLGSFMMGIAEAVAIGEAAGLDRSKVIETLEAGAGSSGVLAAKASNLLNEDFSPHFTVALMHKDLHYLDELAWDLKKPIFAAAAAKDLYALAFTRGLSDMDFSAVYRILKEM